VCSSRHWLLINSEVQNSKCRAISCPAFSCPSFSAPPLERAAFSWRAVREFSNGSAPQRWFEIHYEHVTTADSRGITYSKPLFYSWRLKLHFWQLRAKISWHFCCRERKIHDIHSWERELHVIFAHGNKSSVAFSLPGVKCQVVGKRWVEKSCCWNEQFVAHLLSICCYQRYSFQQQVARYKLPVRTGP